jgi:two-component system response regulator PrrA
MASILIADDDVVIRVMFARALGAVGECESVGTGEDAVELLSKRRFDAVILDLNMPGGDGFSVLSEMRRDGSLNADTLVCVVSADGTCSTRVRAMRDPRPARSLFLTKPVRLATLTAVVGEALRRRLGPASIPPPS